jgi:sugar lactone lactonase YvrE
MALDAEGALWIGDAAGNGASRIREGGETIDFVPTGDLAVYAVALGGADRRTLFLCAAPPLPHGRPEVERRAVLLSCRVDSPGVGLP